MKELFGRLGLNKNETTVYLTLSEMGETTTGPLIKKTSIPSSKIYSILGSLIEKGLVGYFIHGGVKTFRANKPLVLRHLLDIKEQELTKLREEVDQSIPLLEKAFFEATNSNYNVEVLEGLRGIKTVYDLSLSLNKAGGKMYTIGYPLLASTLLNAYFKEFHKKLTARSIRAKVLYDYDTWFAKKRESRPYADQRYLPKGIKTPAFIHIFNDYVGIMVITEHQKLSILIKNREIAQSYLEYFNLLWRLGKK